MKKLTDEEKRIKRQKYYAEYYPKNKHRKKEYLERNKDYIRERSKKYRETSPVYAAHQKRRCSMNERLKYTFGITESDYYKMLNNQNGVCAICKNPETKIIKDKVQRLSVDHCHTSGKIRGLLCDKCNHGLGMFRDNTEYMLSAIQYLNN